MAGRTTSWFGVVPLVAAMLIAFASPAEARDAGHGFGRMGPSYARTISVSPTSGPDFEMPFVCGTTWTGSTRSTHSPSAYTIDFNAPYDRGKPVLASAPGVVTKAVSLTTSYGRYVVVDHGNGFTTLYAHLEAIVTTVGTYLDQGDLVGYLGTSGNSTGPHLHFEQRKDGAYFAPYFNRTVYKFGSTTKSGNCNDRPVVGDWNGDGKSEVGVYRTTPGYGQFRQLVGDQTTAVQWGWPNDTPLVGDWDGDKTAQVAIRRVGATNFYVRDAQGRVTMGGSMGYPSDLPIAGDWNADGTTDRGVYRASTRQFWTRVDGGPWSSLTWGDTGEIPVPADWDGDGITDAATWSPQTGMWDLRLNRGGSYSSYPMHYGVPGDLPFTGDWNGDGQGDIGIWRASTGQFWLRVPDASAPYGVVNKVFAYGNRR